MFVKNRACRKCGTPDFVCRGDHANQHKIGAPSRRLPLSLRGAKRRGNLLAGSSLSYIVPGDSHGALPLGMTELGIVRLFCLGNPVAPFPPCGGGTPGTAFPTGAFPFDAPSHRLPLSLRGGRSPTWQSPGRQFDNLRSTRRFPRGDAPRNDSLGGSCVD